MASCSRPWPVLVLSCILTFSAMGLVFGMGAIFTDIMDTYHVSRATASLVQSVCLGVSFGIGLVTGNFVEWKGPRVTVIMGAAVATVGYVIAFLANHIVQVIIGIGIIAGIGVSFTHLASQIVTGIVFYDMKGMALSLFSVFTAGGSVVCPLLLRHVTNHYSLRGTFLIMGAINCQLILCGALIGLFIPRTPEKTVEIVEQQKEAEAADDEADDVAVLDVARDEEKRSHGNPRKSSDGGEDGRCSVEGNGDEERVTFTARDQNTAAAGSALSDTAAESETDEDSNKSKLDTHLESHLEDDFQADIKLPKHETARLMPETERTNVRDPRNSISSVSSSLVRSTHFERANSFELTPLEDNHNNSDTSRESRKRRPVGKLRDALGVQLELLRNVQFVIFAMLCPSAFLFFLQPMMFMTDMVKSNQLTVEDGSFFLTTMFVGSVTGRVTAGLLHRWLKSRLILLVISFAIAGGGVTCLFYSLVAAYPHFIVVSVIYGFCYGLYSASLPMVFLEILGPSKFAVGMGYMATVAGAFVLFAGPYGGTIRDLTESYVPLYYIATAHGLLVGFVLVVTALRCRLHS